jgi:hypothetical protein
MKKVKIQRFLSGLPTFYSDKIQYDNPKNLEKVIRRENHLYDKIRGSSVFQKDWNDNMKGKRDKRNKCLSHPSSKITPKQINKVSEPKISIRLQIQLGKGQGSIMYNVMDVRQNTYIGTSLTNDKE